MESVRDNWDFWQRLLDMLQQQFGEKSEIILHDLTGDYNHSIVSIRNGYITGRKEGDCGSNLGLEVLRGTVKDGDRYNYIINSKDGKLLRSSTMFLKNGEGKIIGSLCINTDITDTVKFEHFLRRYNRFEIPTENDNHSADASSLSMASDSGKQNEQPIEIFAKDVSQVLDYLIEGALHHVGKSVEEMKRADKIEFIRYLDNKGAFLITKSSERVYEFLNISKFTLYNYLDTIHKESQAADIIKAQ